MKRLPEGQKSEYYATFTTMEMRQPDIDRLLLQRIKECERALQRRFRDWNQFPSCAQLALLDMEYNVGEGGLFGGPGHRGFPLLIAAAASHDWNTCAAECHRNIRNEKRNDDTRMRFTQAAKLDPLTP